MLLPWWAWSVVSNFAILFVEFQYRKGGFASYFDALPVIILPILVLQCGLFYTFRDAPSYMLGWAVYFVGSALLRFVTAALVGEPASLTTVCGVMLIALGAYVVKLGS